MRKLATTDTIFSNFQPWLSCYGICLINTPPNGRYRQLSAGHPPCCNSERVRGTFVPCEARILWYSTDKTSSRILRDTTRDPVSLQKPMEPEAFTTRFITT